MSFLKVMLDKLLGSDAKTEAEPAPSSPAKAGHGKSETGCCGGCGGGAKTSNGQSQQTKPQ